MKETYLEKKVTCLSQLFIKPIRETIQKEYGNSFLIYVEEHHVKDEQKVRECCFRVVVRPEEICSV